MSTTNPQQALAAIRTETKETDNVEKAIQNQTYSLIDSAIEHPLDCGVKRFRGISVTPIADQNQQSDGLHQRFLLTIRGTLSNGDDVVAFIRAESWVGCFVDFNYRCELGQIEWKVDKPRNGHTTTVSFIESIGR